MLMRITLTLVLSAVLIVAAASCTPILADEARPPLPSNSAIIGGGSGANTYPILGGGE